MMTLDYTAIVLALITMVSGWVTYWFDRRKHRQEVEGLKADSRQKDMDLRDRGDGSLIRLVVRDKSHYSDICRDRRGRNREDIGSTIKHLAVMYAMYYNQKYSRSGHVFQDRFKSEPVNDLAYFVTLLRYIHQNPTKAGMVSKVGDYDWRDVRGD